jgi:hypothetical protein
MSAAGKRVKRMVYEATAENVDALVAEATRLAEQLEPEEREHLEALFMAREALTGQPPSA